MTQLRRLTLAICAALLAMSTAGCNSASPSAPALLSDPEAILSGSFVALGSATSLHLDGTLGGTINAASIGALSGLSGTIKIDGTKIVGDVDVSKQAFDVTLTLPSSLFGFKFEAILVGGYEYTRFDAVSDKYTRTAVPSALLPSGATAGATPDIAGMLKVIPSQLESSGTTAVLVGLDAVDGADAYHLRLNVPAGLVSQAMGAIGGTALAGVTLDSTTLDYWVYRDGLQPARLEARATSSTLGTVDLVVTMTLYDKPVTIQAPPESQVEAG